jgi:hypothetical protein
LKFLLDTLIKNYSKEEKMNGAHIIYTHMLKMIGLKSGKNKRKPMFAAQCKWQMRPKDARDMFTDETALIRYKRKKGGKNEKTFRDRGSVFVLVQCCFR